MKKFQQTAPLFSFLVLHIINICLLSPIVFVLVSPFPPHLHQMAAAPPAWFNWRFLSLAQYLLICEGVV